MKISKTAVGLTLVALLALTMRLVYLHQSTENPFFDTPVVDARRYVELAQSLASGDWQGPQMPYWQPPLYPYFLGSLFYFSGENYYLPRLIQAVVGATTCVLLFFLGRRVFSSRVAWVAAFTAALYGPFIYFDGELLPASWGVCSNVLLLLLLLWAASGRGWGRWLMPGLMLGASALMVANVLLVAPVVVVWACCFVPSVGNRGPALLPYLNRSRLLELAAFFLGIGLLVGPITLRNRIVGGEWVLISYNYGVNFYIGNNANYDGTLEIRPGRQWLELVNTPKREAGIEGYGAGAHYFMGKSWDFLVLEPVSYFKLLLRKTLLFWHGDEIRRNLDLYFARNYSSLLQTLLWKYGLAFPFGLVSACALFGLGRFLLDADRRTPAGSLALLFTATYIGTVVLFFITGRHRLPVVPLLLLFSAYGAVRIVQEQGNKRLLFGGVLLALLIATNAGVGAMQTEGDASQHYLMGVALENKGMKANALQAYRSAVALEPTHEGGLAGMAAVSGRMGREEEAAAIWDQLLEHYPDRDDIRLKLADLHLLKAAYDKAITQYQQMLPRQPDRAALHGRLAYAYAMKGAFDQAESAYRKTLELKPDSLLVHYQLAQLYEQHEWPEQAVAEYRALLAQRPDHIGGLADLGRLLASQGQEQEAEPYLLKALALNPRWQPALHTLGMIEANQGRYEAAIQHFQAILALNPEALAARRALAHMLVKTGHKERGDAEYERYRQSLRQQQMRQQTQQQTGAIMNQLLEQFNPAKSSSLR
jgi:tetratricopeptide (TPR) repeat protein